MNDRKINIITELEKNLEDTIAFFKSLSPDELSIHVYQDGAKWTVKQILAHFVTIERSIQWLFKNFYPEARVHRKISIWSVLTAPNPEN